MEETRQILSVSKLRFCCFLTFLLVLLLAPAAHCFRAFLGDTVINFYPSSTALLQNSGAKDRAGFPRKPIHIKTSVDEPIDLSEYAVILVDSTKSMSHKQVLSCLTNLNSEPLTSFEFEEKYTRGKYAYWLQYGISNDLTTEIEVGIDLGVFDSVHTFVYADENLVQEALCGNRVAPKDNHKNALATYFRTRLAPGKSYQFLSRITNEIEINRKISPAIVNPLSYENSVLSRFTTIYSLQSAFLAILFIVFIINLFQFVLNKERAFLFYSLYVLLIFAFFARDFYCTSPIILFGLSTVCHNTYISPLMTASLIFYALFVITFLETKQREPLLHKTLLISIGLCLLYLLIERIIDFQNPYLAWKLYGYFKISILGANLIIVFLVTRIKNPLSFFILTGTSVLLLSAIATAFLSFRPVHFVDYLDTTYIPQYIGVLLELFLFSIGLGYKTKLTEYERRKANSELVLKDLEIVHEKELWSVRSQFYTQITHEFRTPLTVILGMTDDLQANIKSKHLDKAETSLEMIQRNGKNLLHLVNEMLDLAKLDSGNMELQMVRGDVVPFVKYLCESFQSLAQASQIDLMVYAEIDALVMDFDADKLSAVISNLLSNAIKFTAPGGKIIVHLNRTPERENEYFLLKVKDNGAGISEEAIPKIFDRFYQVENSSSRKGEGTGVGLALTKEFVILMRGTIDVKSVPGKGSEFTVRIPVSRNAPETIVDKVYPSYQPKSSTSTHLPEFFEPSDNDEDLPLALIIEDNTDVAHYLQTCLQGKYLTLHAINGTVGIEMAFEKMPDIIICDVMMPGKDGFEVCATLKSDARTDHIPIIILTAKATMKDRLTGLAHGADAYLEKPFVKAELFTRLDQLVLLRKKMLHKFENGGFTHFLNKHAENPETKFLQNAVKIIHEELNNDAFGSRQLAYKLHLSESQLYRKLKAITGKSTAIFIRSIRLQKAKELILTTDKTISEVAYEVGFNDPSWFSRAFREEFGFAPSETIK